MSREKWRNIIEIILEARKYITEMDSVSRKRNIYIVSEQLMLNLNSSWSDCFTEKSIIPLVLEKIEKVAEKEANNKKTYFHSNKLRKKSYNWR